MQQTLLSLCLLSTAFPYSLIPLSFSQTLNTTLRVLYKSAYSCKRVYYNMGNACCGGELTLPAQPGLPLQSAQILQSVLEFSESARTSEPLRDLEAAIESLLCEIDSLEGDFILARNSAESSLDRLEKDLEAFKNSPQPQFSGY